MKDKDGDIEMKYKHWTRDSKWLPEGDGLKLIKVMSNKKKREIKPIMKLFSVDIVL